MLLVFASALVFFDCATLQSVDILGIFQAPVDAFPNEGLEFVWFHALGNNGSCLYKRLSALSAQQDDSHEEKHSCGLGTSIYACLGIGISCKHERGMEIILKRDGTALARTRITGGSLHRHTIRIAWINVHVA